MEKIIADNNGKNGNDSRPQEDVAGSENADIEKRENLSTAERT